MRSLVKDFFAVMLAGAVFAASGWLFYNDINSTLKNIEGEEIGVIIYKKNTAQRKYSGRTVWENIETAETLYNYDTIRTTSDSEAVILMKDGTEITLQDSSLVVLEWGEQEKNIEFLGGNISAKNKAADNVGVQIKSQDTVISLTDATVKLEQGTEGRLGLSVVDGNIDVTKGSVKQEIKTNQKAFIDRDMDSFTVNEFSIQPVTPDDNSYFLTFTNSQEILLSWDVLKSVDEPVLQIASDFDFKKIIDSGQTGENNNAIKTLSEGTYYWRFVSGATGEAESQTRRFVVINDNYPNPASPSPDIDIQYRTQLPKIRFLWNQGIFPDFYLLEISRNENFSETVVSEKVTGNSQIINNLSAGSYYWRITPHYALGNIGYTTKGKVQSFTVTRNTELAPVSLIYPPDKIELNTIETAKGIKFKWKEESEIKSYQFYFSVNPSFATTIYNEPLTSPAWSIGEEIKPGTYYWKVGGITSDNEVLPHSESRSITVKQATGDIVLTGPVNDEHFEIPLLGSRTFTWDSTIGEKFKFTLYKDSLDTTPIIEDVVSAKSRKTLIPASGDYFWQVSVIDESGRAVIDSNVSRFSTRIPLIPPALSYPAPDEEVRIIGEKPFGLSWEKVPGADYYSIEIENNTAGRIVVPRTETSENSFFVDNTRLFSEGNHIVRLKSYKKGDGKWGISESGESSSAFLITEVIIYDAPELTSPVDRAVVSMEDVLSGLLVFEWAHRPVLDRYELSVSDSFNFDRNLSIFSAGGSGYRLTDIKPGRYFWKVKGYDSRNLETPASSINSLVVEEIKPLVQPAILSPSSGSNINMDNRDSLAFSWQGSPDDQYYSLSFYQEGNSGDPLMSIEKYTGTDYSFTDLEKLDIGSFIFEVQAWKDLPGNEKRKSPVSSSRFRITLSQPEEVEIIIIGE